MRKHKADNVENNRETRTISKDGAEEKKTWKDVKVGDIVQLKNRELVPADIVLLATSDPNGLAYTMTANLDGETNLKLRNFIIHFVKFIEISHNRHFAEDAFDLRI